jgi:hypothetical protein
MYIIIEVLAQGNAYPLNNRIVRTRFYNASVGK